MIYKPIVLLGTILSIVSMHGVMSNDTERRELQGSAYKASRDQECANQSMDRTEETEFEEGNRSE